MTGTPIWMTGLVLSSLKHFKDMPQVEFKNGTQITAGHLKISLWIIGSLITLVGTLMLIIYNDFKSDQTEKDLRQDKYMEKIYEEVVFSTTVNTITLEVIKDYLESRDTIKNYFDERVNLKYELLKSRKRGTFISQETVLDNLAFD